MFMKKTLNSIMITVANTSPKSIQLTNEACFNYSLAVVLLSIIGFAMNWLSSKKQELRIKVNT